MTYRTCDGARLVAVFRAAVGQPRGARRGGQRPERLPGPGRRYRHEHAGNRPGRARRGRSGRRRIGRAGSGGDQLRRVDGRPGELGRDHVPDLPGDRRGPRRQAPVQRPRPRPRPDPRRGACLRGRRQARRGHDPDRDPRGRGRCQGGSRARRRHRDGPGGDGRRGRGAPSPRRRRSCRSCARRASSTPAARASTGSSRVPCSHLVGGVAGRCRGARRTALAPSRRRSSPTPTRASATRRCSCSSPDPGRSSIVDAIRRGSRRSASRWSSWATARPSRSTSTASTRTSSSSLRSGPRQPEPDQRREPRPAGPRGARAAGHRVHRPPGPRSSLRRQPTRPGPAARTGDPGRSPWPSSPSPRATAWRPSSVTSASPRSSGAASRPTRAPASCSRRSRSANAVETLLLPNNPNVILAARQVAALTARAVHVVPTRNAAEGIAALLALDPDAGGAANADEMTAGRAGRSSRSR